MGANAGTYQISLTVSDGILPSPTATALLVVDYDHPVLGKLRTAGFPVAMSETPLQIRERAPEFGEHTERVLIDMLGLDWPEIATRQDEEVI